VDENFKKIVMVHEILRKCLLQDQQSKICTDCLLVLAYLLSGLLFQKIFWFSFLVHLL